MAVGLSGFQLRRAEDKGLSAWNSVVAHFGTPHRRPDVDLTIFRSLGQNSGTMPRPLSTNLLIKALIVQRLRENAETTKEQLQLANEADKAAALLRHRLALEALLDSDPQALSTVN
jgi:hypothetical protein